MIGPVGGQQKVFPNETEIVAGDRAEPRNKPRVWDLSKFSQPPVRISQYEFSLTPRREKRNAEHVVSPQCSGEQVGRGDFETRATETERKTRCFSNEQHRSITSARAPGSTVVPLSPRALTRVIRKPRCRPGACPRRCAPRLRVSRRAHPCPSFASGKAGGGAQIRRGPKPRVAALTFRLTSHPPSIHAGQT